MDSARVSHIVTRSARRIYSGEPKLAYLKKTSDNQLRLALLSEHSVTVAMHSPTGDRPGDSCSSGMCN